MAPSFILLQHGPAILGSLGAGELANLQRYRRDIECGHYGAVDGHALFDFVTTVGPGRLAKIVPAGLRAGSAADGIYSSVTPMQAGFPELDGVDSQYVPGALRGVNTNCVSCVNAATQRLLGADPNTTASITGYQGYNDLLPSYPFGMLPDEMSPAAVEQKMLEYGDGTLGVVSIHQGGVFHVINVVNRGGKVYFIDAQMGAVVTLRPDAVLDFGRR